MVGSLVKQALSVVVSCCVIVFSMNFSICFCTSCAHVSNVLVKFRQSVQYCVTAYRSVRRGLIVVARRLCILATVSVMFRRKSLNLMNFALTTEHTFLGCGAGLPERNIVAIGYVSSSSFHHLRINLCCSDEIYSLPFTCSL